MSKTVEQWLAIPVDDLPLALAGRPTAACPVPELPTIDWNTAKYWQAQCDAFQFREQLWLIWHSLPEGRGSFVEWVISKARIEDYLIAAAMAVERMEK